MLSIQQLTGGEASAHNSMILCNDWVSNHRQKKNGNQLVAVEEYYELKKTTTKV